MKEWKNKIPSLMKERGVSASELQRRAGMSYTGVHKIVHSKSIPWGTTAKTLDKIARALGVDPRALWE